MEPRGPSRSARRKDFSGIDHPVTTLMGANGPESAEVGYGSIHYLPIIKAAKAAGIEHFFIEREPPFVEMPAIEAAQADYLAVHDLLEKA